MPKLVPITATKLIKILERMGFELVRTRGSHHFFIHPITGKTTSVPMHRGEDLGTGLLRQILRDIDVEVADYDRLRTKKK